MNVIPDRPGFYWARWMIPSDELEGGSYDYTPGPWEPVELVDGDGGMFVEMLNIPARQSADHFHWGTRLVPPEGQPRDVQINKGVNESAAAAFRRMTMAERIEAGSKRK